MEKRFGIEVKYYASSLRIQMCNHWAPKTYLRNGTLEECRLQIKLDSRFFLIHSTQALFQIIVLKVYFYPSSTAYFGMRMAKRFGVEVKYYASPLQIQMCTHWAPKTYLRNGALEDCGVQIKYNLGFFLIQSIPTIF